VMSRTSKEKTSAWVRTFETRAGRMGVAVSERGLVLSTLLGWAGDGRAQAACDRGGTVSRSGARTRTGARGRVPAPGSESAAGRGSAATPGASGERVPAGRPRWSVLQHQALERRGRVPAAVSALLDQVEEALKAYYAYWPECPGDRIFDLWEDILALPVDLEGLTAFTSRVLTCLRQVPPGQVISYGALAARAGSPNAARAVGAVMARNPVPIVLPCHRVIAADGSLGGFAGGSRGEALALKSRLLRYEGWTFS